LGAPEAVEGFGAFEVDFGAVGGFEELRGEGEGGGR